MPIMNLGEVTVDVDIKEELRKYTWYKDKWTTNRLIACSPFRKDKSPSFFVDLESGGWGDSGAGLGEYGSGNFITLIALLNEIDYVEAIQYLQEEHNVLYQQKENEEVFFESPKLTKVRDNVTIDASDKMLVSFSKRLEKRGINSEVQSMFRIGYNPEVKNHTAMPWIDYDGVTANIKYRSTVGKRFFYEKEGKDINLLVYGAHLHREIKDTIVVVEGEIDAMSFWEAGIPAIALGHADINENQAYIIRNLDVQEIVLAGDNDEQGEYLNLMTRERLGKVYNYSVFNYGNYGDANEVLTKEGTKGIIDKYNERKQLKTLVLTI